MDNKTLFKVMKKTEAIVNGTDKMGLMATGHDPLQMSDTQLESLLKNDGIEDVKGVFEAIDLQAS